MKKLIEGLPFYRDKLHEKVVCARFQEILVKVSAECSIKIQITIMAIIIFNRLAQTKPRTNPTLS